MIILDAPQPYTVTHALPNSPLERRAEIMRRQKLGLVDTLEAVAAVFELHVSLPVRDQADSWTWLENLKEDGK